MLVRYEHRDAVRGYDQAVDARPDTYQWNSWFVYPEYVVEPQSSRPIYAPMSSAKQFRGREEFRPLSRAFSSLFLRFARWPEKHEMDIKPLDTDNNAEAASEWVHEYGVLGVDPPDTTVLGDSPDAIRLFLGRLGPDGLRGRGTRNDASGGPLETVERFAGEAWEANIVLRLYEAASNPNGPDVDTIVGFMPDRKEGYGDDSRHWASAWDLHGTTPERARSWALSIVGETVERKIRGRCWPVPVRRDDGSHGQGWAFDSLLGAMWLQMLWLMLGSPRKCAWCGAVLPPESRSDRRFCDDGCKADWNYHNGTGRSSKDARKSERARQRRQRKKS